MCFRFPSHVLQITSCCACAKYYFAQGYPLVGLPCSTIHINPNFQLNSLYYCWWKIGCVHELKLSVCVWYLFLIWLDLNVVKGDAIMEISLGKIDGQNRCVLLCVPMHWEFSSWPDPRVHDDDDDVMHAVAWSDQCSQLTDPTLIGIVCHTLFPDFPLQA